MIKEMVTQQNVECIGGLTAAYADAIMAHVNPGRLHKNDIVVIIKSDKTIWATNADYRDNNNWIEITRNNIQKKTSPIMKKTCYFEINKGELSGTYIITEDFISNEQFYNEKSYLDFIVG